MSRTRLLSLLAALAALLLVLAACADDDADQAAEEPAEDDAPLALDEDDDGDDEGDDEVVEDDEVAEDEAVEEEEALDVEAAVHQYASTLPDGWMAMSDTEEFKDAMAVDGTVLIDVREEGEFAEGHLPGAINIPIRELPENLDKIPTDRPVLIYCASGWRAGLALSSLGLMGYDNLTAYPPSVQGWEADGEELVNEDNEAEVFGEPDLDPAMVDAVGDFLATLPEGFLTNSLDDVKAALDAGAGLVDVREMDAFEEGHIADAIAVPLRTVAAGEAEVPTDTTVIVMCQSGYRASLALPMYHVLGYTNTEGFPGSYNAWVDADEPVVG